jgi:dipeptidyl aminopeptidase/acylaminoacyl peptidase
MYVRNSRRLLCAFCLFSAAADVARAQFPPVRPTDPIPQLIWLDDLYRLDAPTSAVLSPDGKNLAYVRQRIDRDKNCETHSLWLIKGPKAFTQEGMWLEFGRPDARAPVFSPDGKWIAFVSTRARPHGWIQTPPAPPQSDPATDIWLINIEFDAAIPLAGPDKPYGRVFNDGFYGHVAFSPDGKKLVFAADDGKDARTKRETDNNVATLRPDQGEGYTGYGPAQIWIAHLDEKPEKFAASKIERLTNDDVWYGDPHWSPDGKMIVVHANRTNDCESVRYSINKNFDIWAMDVATHKLTQLTSGPGPEVSPRFSPDGKKIACLSIPRKGSHRDVFNLAIITLSDGGPHTEILFDHHGPGADMPPHPAPAFPLPEDCWDGPEHVVIKNEYGVRTRFERVNIMNGKSESIDTSLNDDPKRDPVTFTERLARRRELTPPANPFLKMRLFGETKTIHWKNDRGEEIEGVLTLPWKGNANPIPGGWAPIIRGIPAPPKPPPGPPYRLLVLPHGGPHSRSTLEFNITAEVFAARGYAVFQPNFRGSSGYGQKFIDADRGDFGGGDMRDILTGIDYLVKEKIVDPKRQFIYGTSYGGFMTCWLVGHTNQFRAAVAQNAVTDLNAMWSLSDLQSWTEWEFGGKPWEVPAALREHSPLTYAANVKTPTLILHSADDRRCPLPMGRMFYQALHDRNVPTEMVVYPGEGHGIRDPKHRVDVLTRALAWFEKYDRK